MLAISNISKGSISPEFYGGKAAGLSLLHSNGYVIPEAIAIEACRDVAIFNDIDFQANLRTQLVGWDVEGNYDIAVRSSCTIEDSFQESMAGHFDTFIGKMAFEDVISNIKKVVLGLSKIDDNFAKMGVIIQKKVNAEYSGVIFSSHPLTYSKKTMIIGYVAGMGQQLVSGKAGKEVLVAVQDENYTIEDLNALAIKETLILLACKTKELERILNYPIDIEWALVGTDVYFLQCRPLASITKIRTELQRVNEQNLCSLPLGLISSYKIKFRLSAEKTGTMVPNAYVYIRNSCRVNDLTVLNLPRSQHCKGYNAVVIYPELVNGKVMRSFIGDKTKVYDYTASNYQYSTKSFPKYENLKNCLLDYSVLVSNEYWVSSTIIQEIFDPLYTGAIRKIADGFLVEITRGHFFGKGVTPASCYVVNENGQVLSKREVSQEVWYQILEGHVFMVTCNGEEKHIVSLADDNVKSIVDYFKVSFVTETAVIEFGVLQQQGLSDIQLYMTDFVEGNSGTIISASDINEGIVSRGRITGKVVHVDGCDTSFIDLHFFDSINENNECEENIVFFCNRPDIVLLSLLEKYNPRKIGFVFNEAPLTCHFAVVLQEKRIPAICIGDTPWYNEGTCTVDAETQGIKDRLSR